MQVRMDCDIVDRYVASFKRAIQTDSSLVKRP